MDLSDNERSYLHGQRLGRLATLGPDGGPQSRPVGFQLNEELGTIDIDGYDLAKSQKYRNIRRDGRVSFVVDDLASIDPWAPRGIELRGVAEAISGAGPDEPGELRDLIRIHPTRVLAWGLDTGAFAPPKARDVDGA